MGATKKPQKGQEELEELGMKKSTVIKQPGSHESPMYPQRIRLGLQTTCDRTAGNVAAPPQLVAYTPFGVGPFDASPSASQG